MDFNNKIKLIKNPPTANSPKVEEVKTPQTPISPPPRKKLIDKNSPLIKRLREAEEKTKMLKTLSDDELIELEFQEEAQAIRSQILPNARLDDSIIRDSAKNIDSTLAANVAKEPLNINIPRNVNAGLDYIEVEEKPKARETYNPNNEIRINEIKRTEIKRVELPKNKLDSTMNTSSPMPDSTLMQDFKSPNIQSQSAFNPPSQQPPFATPSNATQNYAPQGQRHNPSPYSPTLPNTQDSIQQDFIPPHTTPHSESIRQMSMELDNDLSLSNQSYTEPMPSYTPPSIKSSASEFINNLVRQENSDEIVGIYKEKKPNFFDDEKEHRVEIVDRIDSYDVDLPKNRLDTLLYKSIMGSENIDEAIDEDMLNEMNRSLSIAQKRLEERLRQIKESKSANLNATMESKIFSEFDKSLERASMENHVLEEQNTLDIDFSKQLDSIEAESSMLDSINKSLMDIDSKRVESTSFNVGVSENVNEGLRSSLNDSYSSLENTRHNLQDSHSSLQNTISYVESNRDIESSPYHVESSNFIDSSPETNRVGLESYNKSNIEIIESSPDSTPQGIAYQVPHSPYQATLANKDSSHYVSNSNEGFSLPPLSLLNTPPLQKMDIDDSEIDEKVYNLFHKLRVFKIEGDIVRTYSGPVVTTFEFRPAVNVKVSRIQNLQDDLSMALKATSIRIQAPIPGKDVVGIEIPNNKIQTIYLREIFESEAFANSRANLAIALGKNVIGEPIIEDLATLPHLLIAGTTGSGKSVGLNAMILSLLYKNTPKDLRLIMIDPKFLEFGLYKDIPHLLTPIITDPKKAIIALSKAVDEMNRRYELMDRVKVKTIVGYNEYAMQNNEEKLPYIVIIIDEFADLMIMGGREAEQFLISLAGKARASGIHLIIATQRPTVNVVTGLIKGNLPSKISYRVGSKIDSKVILDEVGAEALLGKGDMLFSKTNAITRLHAPYNDEREIERVVEFIKAQQEVEYDEFFSLEQRDNAPSQIAPTQLNSEADYIQRAKEIILQSQKTSISYLQRSLGVGFNKAASIVETLQKEGFLSEPNAKGIREILG